jgi:TetR/AcrR family transcriptional regulator, transcriptional repressor for nem operon
VPATIEKKNASIRQRILDAAFAEFYRNGFQAGSLNHILAAAGTTKGALFHHFPSGKQELGYAVTDEIIEPIMQTRWLAPLRGSSNPIDDIQEAFRKHMKEDMETGSWLQGCPLNNLAQEMSPLDDGFRHRIDGLYAAWRKCYATALAGGIKAKTVKKDISPRNAAALIVAAQMGIWGTGKYSKSEKLMGELGEALGAYLQTLRP